MKILDAVKLRLKSVNDLKNIEQKHIVFVAFISSVFLLISLIAASKIAYNLRCVYRVPQDANSAAILGAFSGAWGSFLGGLLGGVGTLIAVLISTKQTSLIQQDNRDEEKLKRK